MIPIIYLSYFLLFLSIIFVPNVVLYQLCSSIDMLIPYILSTYRFAGSAMSMLSSKSVSEADRFVKELTSLDLKPSRTGMYVPPCFPWIYALFCSCLPFILVMEKESYILTYPKKRKSYVVAFCF